MTMDPQLITAGGHIDITTADFSSFSYPVLDKLVAQLINARKAASHAKQRAILYHKLDVGPKNFSDDFNSLLSIRYGSSEDTGPLRDFLLNLTLPAFLQVIYSLTRKHLEAGTTYLPDFAKHADKHAKFKQSLVARASLELEKGPDSYRLEFERDVYSFREGDSPLDMSLLYLLLTLFSQSSNLVRIRRVEGSFRVDDSCRFQAFNVLNRSAAAKACANRDVILIGSIRGCTR